LIVDMCFEDAAHNTPVHDTKRRDLSCPVCQTLIARSPHSVPIIQNFISSTFQKQNREEVEWKWTPLRPRPRRLPQKVIGK
jgi:hypothetical protein